MHPDVTFSLKAFAAGSVIAWPRGYAECDAAGVRAHRLAWPVLVRAACRSESSWTSTNSMARASK